MTITPEVKSELLTMLREEMERQEIQKRENRTTYQRVCKEFEQQISAFDYVRRQKIFSIDGNVYIHTSDRPMASQIRNALGALLKAVYQADTTAKLPAEKEAQMRAFISSVLGLMNEQKNAPPGDDDTRRGRKT